TMRSVYDLVAFLEKKMPRANRPAAPPFLALCPSLFAVSIVDSDDDASESYKCTARHHQHRRASRSPRLSCRRQCRQSLRRRARCPQRLTCHDVSSKSCDDADDNERVSLSVRRLWSISRSVRSRMFQTSTLPVIILIELFSYSPPF